MSNGNMKVVNSRYEGEVRTMRIFLRFFLERNPKAGASEKTPTHLIQAKSPMGHIFQAGVAWERSITRGDNAGETMFSIMLEDPEFGDAPIYLTAFPGQNGEYSLSLERKRQETPSHAAQSPDLPQAA